MKKLLLRSTLLIGTQVLLFSTTDSHAATINWGPSFTPDNYFSNGDPLDGSGAAAVTFQLGAFAIGFTPSATNTALWEANWTVANTVNTSGVATGTATSTYSTTGNNNYGGSVETAGFTTAGIAAGTPIYIWGYTQKAIDTTTQWTLFSAANVSASGPQTNNWVAPSTAGDQGNPAIDWEPIASTNVVFGGTSTGTGGGVVDTPQTLTENQVQLYRVIPESSSLVLLLLGGLTFTRRKR